MNNSLPRLPDKAPEALKPASDKGNFALDDDERENLFASAFEPASVFAIEEDGESTLLPKTVDNNPAKLMDRLNIAAERVKKSSPAPASALPSAPAQPKLKLDTLELPSGMRLDPESWGIDLEFVPEVSGSTNFLMDDDDEEAVHLVEMPAELRAFMNTETAKDLSPDQMKAIFVEVIQEELKKFSDSQPPAIPAPSIERVVRETTHERVIERVNGTIEADVPTAASLGKKAVWIAIAITFLWNWELGLILGFVFGGLWTAYQMVLVKRGVTQIVGQKVQRIPASPPKAGVEHRDPELSRMDR